MRFNKLEGTIVIAIVTVAITAVCMMASNNAAKIQELEDKQIDIESRVCQMERQLGNPSPKCQK